MTATLVRETILQALREALQASEGTVAMWEGGAAAFGRVDEWSDMDVVVVVHDEHVPETLELVDRTLRSLSEVELMYEPPMPTWHGHNQRFYRLKDASPFHLVDITLMKQSSPNKFNEPQMHGNAVVHFDKAGVTQSPPFDYAALETRLTERIETLRVMFGLFQALTLKELNRGNLVEALAFYHGFTLRPLIEALRIRHSPERHAFHTRYVYYDLPKEDVQKLEQLFFVQNGADLRLKQSQAETWFYQSLAEAEAAVGQP